MLGVRHVHTSQFWVILRFAINKTVSNICFYHTGMVCVCVCVCVCARTRECVVWCGVCVCVCVCVSVCVRVLVHICNMDFASLASRNDNCL